MNESGRLLKELKKYDPKLQNKSILLIHDDIDLPFGKIRITENVGARGHNGVRSIINAL